MFFFLFSGIPISLGKYLVFLFSCLGIQSSQVLEIDGDYEIYTLYFETGKKVRTN